MGHGGPVWCVDFYKDLLVSGSYDKTIKVWNMRSGQNLCTLRGHTSWVSCVKVRNPLAYCGFVLVSMKYIHIYYLYR